jgi:hypothetical protein
VHDAFYNRFTLQCGADLESDAEVERGMTAGGQCLHFIKQISKKFQGKTPQSGNEWYSFYVKLGRSVFDKIDSNKDGFLDKDDLKKAALAVQLQMMPPCMHEDFIREFNEVDGEGDQMLEAVFASMDTNNDGKISFEEAFKAFLKSWILKEDSDADTNMSEPESTSLTADVVAKFDIMSMDDKVDQMEKLSDMIQGIKSGT